MWSFDIIIAHSLRHLEAHVTTLHARHIYDTSSWWISARAVQIISCYFIIFCSFISALSACLWYICIQVETKTQPPIVADSHMELFVLLFREADYALDTIRRPYTSADSYSWWRHYTETLLLLRFASGIHRPLANGWCQLCTFLY